MLPAEYKEMWIQTERGEKNITEINRGSGARSGIKLWVADWRGFPFRNGKLLRSTCRHNLSTSTVQLCKSAQTATASELWLLYPVKMFYVDLYLCNSVAHILIFSYFSKPTSYSLLSLFLYFNRSLIQAFIFQHLLSCVGYVPVFSMVFKRDRWKKFIWSSEHKHNADLSGPWVSCLIGSDTWHWFDRSEAKQTGAAGMERLITV